MINRQRIMRVASLLFALGVAGQPALARQSPKQVPPQSSSRVPASVLERYTGEYVYPDGNTVTVVLRDGILFRETGGQRIAFVPVSQTLFRLGFVFTAEFVPDGANGMTQILSDGVGVEYRLRRKGSPPVKAEVLTSAVRVPRATLERYVGTYEYIPGQMSRTDLRINVRLRGDTLTRDISGESALVPLSDTRFRVAGTSLVVEFVVDDAGVTQVLGTGFQQMLARLKP